MLSTLFSGALSTSSFGPGFVPISSCTVQDGGSLNCSQITDASCDHSMDLGVVCRTCEQLYNEFQDQCSSTDPPPTSPLVKTPHVQLQPTSTSTCPTVTPESQPCPTSTINTSGPSTSTFKHDYIVTVAVSLKCFGGGATCLQFS